MISEKQKWCYFFWSVKLSPVASEVTPDALKVSGQSPDTT